MVNLEIEEGDESNDDINKEKLINDDEKWIRYVYVNEEDESNKDKNKTGDK